jgi:hypothetical protein
MSTAQETYVPFPLCVKVLIGVYDKIHLHEKYWIYEWNKKKQDYENNKDCVVLMNYVGHNINYFCEHMREMTLKLKGTFTDDCPPQHVRTIMSPNGQTDWSRAVWCIYSVVRQAGFTGTFSADVLTQMEQWLINKKTTALAASDSSSHTIRETLAQLRLLA